VGAAPVSRSFIPFSLLHCPRHCTSSPRQWHQGYAQNARACEPSLLRCGGHPAAASFKSKTRHNIVQADGHFKLFYVNPDGRIARHADPSLPQAGQMRFLKRPHSIGNQTTMKHLVNRPYLISASSSSRSQFCGTSQCSCHTFGASHANAPAQQPRGRGELRVAESLHAPAVCCSGWFGALNAAGKPFSFHQHPATTSPGVS
jgi:hypothetical protein